MTVFISIKRREKNVQLGSLKGGILTLFPQTDEHIAFISALVPIWESSAHRRVLQPRGKQVGFMRNKQFILYMPLSIFLAVDFWTPRKSPDGRKGVAVGQELLSCAGRRVVVISRIAALQSLVFGVAVTAGCRHQNR